MVVASAYVISCFRGYSTWFDKLIDYSTYEGSTVFFLHLITWIPKTHTEHIYIRTYVLNHGRCRLDMFYKDPKPYYSYVCKTSTKGAQARTEKNALVFWADDH